MSLTYLFPAAVAVAALVLATAVHRSVAPRTAAFLLTSTLVATVATVVWTLAMLALDFAVDSLAACRETLSGHVHVPDLLGASSLGLVAWGTFAASRAAHRRRRATRGPTPDGDLLLLDTPSPLAYAVPGRHPHIVISAGMLALLDPGEQRALLAHEFAHLQHHHHRFLALSELAAAFFPPLRFVARRVRFATERWADLDAVREVGDPTIVARAVARAALAGSQRHDGALSISGGDVTARIEELISGSSATHLAGPVPVPIFALVAISAGAIVLQLHHVIDFVGTFCLG